MRNNQPRGEDHYCAKLKSVEVMKIKCLLNLGFSQTLLSKLFGVSYCAIHDIKRGRTWKHI